MICLICYSMRLQDRETLGDCSLFYLIKSNFLTKPCLFLALRIIQINRKGHKSTIIARSYSFFHKDSNMSVKVESLFLAMDFLFHWTACFQNGSCTEHTNGERSKGRYLLWPKFKFKLDCNYEAINPRNTFRMWILETIYYYSKDLFYVLVLEHLLLFTSINCCWN